MRKLTNNNLEMNKVTLEDLKNLYEVEFDFSKTSCMSAAGKAFCDANCDATNRFIKDGWMCASTNCKRYGDFLSVMATEIDKNYRKQFLRIKTAVKYYEKNEDVKTNE